MKKILLFLLISQGCWFSVFSQNGIGIGTTSPSTSAILELKSFTKGFLLPRTSTTSRQAMTGVKGLMVYDSTLNQMFFHSGSAWQQFVAGTLPPTHWSIIGGNIYNNNTGNVGIGVNIPTSKLTVGGDILINEGQGWIYGGDPVMKIQGSAAAGAARLRFIMPDDDPDFAITQALGKLFISRYTGAYGFVADLVVDDVGNVGVGITDPTVSLHVGGGTDVGNGSGGYFQLGPDNNYNIGIDNNEIQGRYNGAVSRLVLNNGGGPVQIGSAIAPTGYSLAVNGKAICEELKIQASSNWPDYVFKENYSLKSLSELRDFIDVHHHLPNIPDAATLEANGIEVGDMQKRMMEKIEELTLYILQLEEKCAAMSGTLEELKAERQ